MTEEKTVEECKVPEKRESKAPVLSTPYRSMKELSLKEQLEIDAEHIKRVHYCGVHYFDNIGCYKINAREFFENRAKHIKREDLLLLYSVVRKKMRSFCWCDEHRRNFSIQRRVLDAGIYCLEKINPSDLDYLANSLHTVTFDMVLDSFLPVDFTTDIYYILKIAGVYGHKDHRPSAIKCLRIAEEMYSASDIKETGVKEKIDQMVNAYTSIKEELPNGCESS
ncbi:hypothetical protein KY363_01760 [Candidatus Woesearchaeota archaeon]|nr:hypothetical protein [Candidatus Woesearchaeota archaeon]